MYTAALPHPCPECGQRTLTLTAALEIAPVGRWSLAGAQTKLAAAETATVACGSCSASCRGRLAGVELASDGHTITSGQFVPDPTSG